MPETLIEPAFIELAREITQQYSANGKTLNFEIENLHENEDDIHNSLTTTLEHIKETIQQRITGNILTEPTTWRWPREGEPQEFHIVKKDLYPILEQLPPVCANCGNQEGALTYSVRSREYGTATLNIIENTTNHETHDTETDGDYEYECGNCNEEINPESIQYLIPEISYIALKEFLQELLSQNQTINIQNTRQITTPQMAPKIFPQGKQIQKDIPAHGPTGPRMNKNTKDIQISGPEEFAFRDNGYTWECKHCSYKNNGTSKQCLNPECKKDKFAPIRTINLIT